MAYPGRYCCVIPVNWLGYPYCMPPGYAYIAEGWNAILPSLLLPTMVLPSVAFIGAATWVGESLWGAYGTRMSSRLGMAGEEP